VELVGQTYSDPRYFNSSCSFAQGPPRRDGNTESAEVQQLEAGNCGISRPVNIFLECLLRYTRRFLGDARVLCLPIDNAECRRGVPLPRYCHCNARGSIRQELLTCRSQDWMGRFAHHRLLRASTWLSNPSCGRPDRLFVDANYRFCYWRCGCWAPVDQRNDFISLDMRRHAQLNEPR